jgi:peptide-methionine (S)-S-oxide reductase
MKHCTAVLGGGCFWCVEAVFSDLKGVLEVIPGYSGGHVENPTYEQVCTNETGHAEVVQITYDADQISYADLLKVFFSTHNPTTLNRQGEDVGTQYRSVIFFGSEEERQTAEEIKREMAPLWDDPIVTEIAPLEKFYPAEDYHRDYFRRNPQQAYCSMVIAPKVAKFRAEYKDRLKAH